MDPATSRIIIQRQDGELLAEYHLGSGEYSVGRDEQNRIRADSQYLSRQHATLNISADGLAITDLGSTHGTFVNGAAINAPTPITQNQSVQLGDLFLTVQDQATQAAAPEMYSAGDLIGAGRYTLHKQLGRGGGGVVWLAQDEHLQQLVAIKRLPPELANDPVALKDLLSEVQKARLLSHPHIIRIHDFVKLPNELPFITMEFVDGTDLNTLRSQQPGGFFTWERLEGLARQLCDALGYAHEQGIVHRDLKPANIMITRDGNLKLADFGIAAKVTDAAPGESLEGDASGTAVYMSPQQMRGESPHSSDDIYALGATLYDLISTRPPFFTGDIFQLVQEAPSPTLSQRMQDFELDNHIPPHVELAIMHCLAKDPVERPQTTAALAELFHPDGEIPPPPPPPNEYIPEMESVLSEPLEQTQKFLEENLPQPVTSWWQRQEANGRDYLLIGGIIASLIACELIYSKLEHKEFFKTVKERRFFQPW